jgi:hypothetical protein
VTITTLARFSSIILAVTIAGGAANLRPTDSNPPSDASHVPKLMHSCLITNDVNQLVQFYEPILAIKAERPSEDYAEFRTLQQSSPSSPRQHRKNTFTPPKPN